MLTFWLLAIILFAIAIAFILYPFIRKTSTESNIDQKQVNIDIAKDQLCTLEENFSQGEVSQEEYDSLKFELESSLIDDISMPQEETTAIDLSPKSNKIIMVMVVVFVPICSMLLYQKLGTPGFVDGSILQKQTAQNDQHSGANQASVNEMVVMLINKLKENPNDQKGWFLLARTYMALEKYDNAYRVYEKLLSLTGDDASILVSMADALAMTKGGKISGEPEQLVLRALKVDANNITGLWLAGIAKKEQGQNQQALNYWNKLYPLVNDDPSAQQSIAKMIESVGGTAPEIDHSDHAHNSMPDMNAIANEITLAAENKGVTKAAISTNSIKVSISLSEQMLKQANANDIVFIYAKAVQGPPMPLAAVKKRVSDLPIAVNLDDRMAMMPQMKISAFAKVKVGARISKSGRPSKQAGDLMSEEIIVDMKNIQDVKLIINSMVK
ncbi:MAG: c-type cytochrome biogenesis protein CcmI [Pseudomonadota bacterium]